MRKHTLSFGLLAAKLGLSGAILWVIAGHIDLQELTRVMTEIKPTYIAGTVAVLIAQMGITGIRLITILRPFGKRLSILDGFRITLIGSFFGQTLISFLSGDAIRVYEIVRRKVDLRTAATTVFLDRVVGVAGMVFLMAAALPAFLSTFQSATLRLGAIVSTAAGIAGVIVFIALGIVLPQRLREVRYIGWLVDFASASRHLIARTPVAIFALTLGIAVQIANVLAVWILAHGVELPVSLGECFMIVPTVSLIAMMPISIAGWGVREGAMVVAFGALGYDTETVLAVSVALGLAQLLVSLPGSIVWLIGRQRSHQA